LKGSQLDRGGLKTGLVGMIPMKQIKPDGQAFSSAGRPMRRRRGIALLLVMIGVVVCCILTAGFLSTQGTSIGIARNERDAQKCRVLAQTGIDMCYWLIRNRSDWRERMPIGAWLSNLPVGDGTVSVAVQDGDNSNSFSDDPSQGVVLTSTGYYDNRSFSLTATIRPTGAGTVFADGNFINGTISVGDVLLLNPSTIDSYNSNNGPYSLTSGSNGNFISNALNNNALVVYFPSVFKGSYTGAPGALISSILSIVGLGGSGPVATSNAAEMRIPGTVVLPNVTGLTGRGAFSKTSLDLNPTFPGPGKYDSVSINGANVVVGESGIYYVTGNISMGSSTSSKITVSNGVSAVFVVNGNVSVVGKVILTGTSQMALFCNGNFTVSGSSSNVNSGGGTGRFTLYGTGNCGSVTISNGASFVGSIFAPSSAVTLQSNSPQFYGAMLAASLTLKNGAQLHFDEALRSLYLSPITGGSASPGTADYRVTITGGPGLGH
jgi:Tfp pilus assembly protein PilX